VLGIEPARNVAAVAIEKGVPTVSEFFGSELAQELRCQGKAAEVFFANNVLAHVADLNDFVRGIRILLARKAGPSSRYPTPRTCSTRSNSTPSTMSTSATIR